MQHSSAPPQAAAFPAVSVPESSTTEAPPKQVALALDRLSHAARLISDVRIGADRFLEALFAVAQPNQSTRPLHLILQEDASMRKNLKELRAVGRQLEDSGVLNDALKARSNSWGLHMPLVCPDGAVVAYAWKRQLAGQAGASAVDRTRLALKAFTDQKRRFFPHLDDGIGSESASKKHCSSQVPTMSHEEELTDHHRSLSDLLEHMEKNVTIVKFHTYDRLDWLRRASLLSSSEEEADIESSKDHSFHSSNSLRQDSASINDHNKIGVIELLCPSVFRAVVSLHPAGSTDPDAVAFFSPDEGGSHVHARGTSVHQVFRHISDHASMALQYFLATRSETALSSLLQWVCNYQTLLTKACSKCRRLLSMDRQSAILLPPIHRPYRNFSCVKTPSSKDDAKAYHVGCFPEDA